MNSCREPLAARSRSFKQVLQALGSTLLLPFVHALLEAFAAESSSRSVPPGQNALERRSGRTMFSSEILAEITEAANRLAIEPAALLAVAEVESGGVAFAIIDGRREPLIRFEGH